MQTVQDFLREHRGEKGTQGNFIKITKKGRADLYATYVLNDVELTGCSLQEASEGVMEAHRVSLDEWERLVVPAIESQLDHHYCSECDEHTQELNNHCVDCGGRVIPLGM